MKVKRLFFGLITVLVMSFLVGSLVTGCGKSGTEPILTNRSTTEDDDARLAVYAYTAFSNFMITVEQAKPLFGVNGGVNYSIYHPAGWDTMVARIPIPSLTFSWRDTVYIHNYQQTDLSIVKFDQNIGSNIPLRPARITWGEYKYGTLFLAIRSAQIPDSLRNRSIPYDIREFDMTYANNGTDPRYLTGTGAISGVVDVQVSFVANGSTISQNQSDTTTAYLTFDNISSQVGDAGVHMRLTARYPYYNPLTDVNSFSRKQLSIEYNVSSDGRGTASVYFGGQERARINFLGRPYYYIGNYFIALDGFQSARTITY